MRSALRPKALTGAALVAAVLATVTPARADDDSEQIALSLGALSGVTVGVPGIVVAVGNGYYIGQNERPSSNWRIAGYIYGGLNLGVGALYMVTAPQGGSVWLPGIGIGAAHIVLGLADIAITFVAVTKSERGGAQFSLAPMPLWDARGRAVPGVSLQIRDF